MSCHKRTIISDLIVTEYMKENQSYTSEESTKNTINMQLEKDGKESSKCVTPSVKQNKMCLSQKNYNI